MKKIFSIIICLFSLLGANAGNENKALKAVFDFAHPTTLTPALDPTPENMSVSVDNVTFTEGKVSCNVRRKTVQNTASPHLVYHSLKDPLPDYIQLYFEAYDLLEISVPKDYEITKIYFGEGSNKVGTLIVDGTPGTYSIDHVWTNTDSKGNTIDGVNNVKLYNTKDCAFINSVIVEYRSPLNILELPSVTPASDTEIYSLDEFSLLFNENISELGTAEIGVKNATGAQVAKVTCVANGKTVTCSLDNAVTDPGTYSVTFPSASFFDSEGYYNNEFTANFTISIQQNTFNPVSELTNEVEKIPSTFYVDFPSTIGKVEFKSVAVMKRNATDVKALANGSINGDNHNQLAITLTPEIPITESGIYTIGIPEGAVHNLFVGTSAAEGERYNEAFTITFKVNGADAPSAEVLKEARDAVALKGIGYAKDDAEARIILEDMVESEEKSDAEFKEAIQALYATMDINMPEDGKYYKVANISQDGVKTFLAYNDGAISYTKSEKDAYPFNAVITNGKYFLKTLDGNFLTVLMNSDDYSLCNKKSVSEESFPLTLARFTAATADNKDTYGMFSIKGNIGKLDGIGEDVVAFSTLRTTESTARDAQLTTFFSPSLSSAFVFVESERPEIITKSVITVYPQALTIETLDKIEVVFPEVSDISASDENYVYVISEGKKYYPTAVNVSGENNNTVIFKFGILPNGIYSFIAEKGAFKYEFAGEDITVQELSKDFTVYSYDDFVADIRDHYNLLCDQNLSGEGHNASAYNNLSFYLTEQDNATAVPVCVNKDVKIEVYNNALNHVTDGHLEKFTVSRDYNVDVLYKGDVYIGLISTYDSNTATVAGKRYWYVDGYQRKTETRTLNVDHFRIVLDTPLTPDNCSGRDLQFYFNKGAFGDLNYGQYLNDPTSIAKKNCHVNAKFSLPYLVDNTATSVKNIDMSEGYVQIFDVTGCRVESMSSPGIYIINGKKYLKK